MRPMSVTLSTCAVAACAIVCLHAAPAAAAESAVPADQEYRSTFRTGQCSAIATGAVHPVSIDFKVNILATTDLNRNQCSVPTGRATWVKLACTLTDDKGKVSKVDSGWKRATGKAVTTKHVLPLPTVKADCAASHGITWSSATKPPSTPITRVLRYRAEA
jgi:hypothetical protein